MKSEPEVFSIESLRLAPGGVSGWDGVRNYEARNFMKAMALGDGVLFYHSNAKPSGVAGVAEVARAAYPDPTQFDSKSGHFDPRSRPDAPLWVQVDLRFIRALPRVVSLEELRAAPALSGMALFRRSRLSVQPVEESQWRTILELAGV